MTHVMPADQESVYNIVANRKRQKTKRDRHTAFTADSNDKPSYTLQNMTDTQHLQLTAMTNRHTLDKT